MVHQIEVTSTDKQVRYEQLMPQIESLINDETDVVANMANISAVLKDTFNWLWVGFYLVKNDNLVLGPFQGPIACTRIKKGQGVCGQSWLQSQTIIVPDVDKFSGHIACSSLSKSEIVVPLLNSKSICVGVLDVDSAYLNYFDNIDKNFLIQITQMLNLE